MEQQMTILPSQFTINSNFIQGLFDGYGNITVYLAYDRLKRLKIKFNFIIVQDVNNIKSLQYTKDYFNCGDIYTIKSTYYKYEVKRISDLKNKILPKLMNSSFNKTNTIKLYKLLYVKDIIDILQANYNQINNTDILKKLLDKMYEIVHKDYKSLQKDHYISLMINKYKIKINTLD
jgi:hypothetical protein